MTCQICGYRPRQFELFGGTKFWFRLFTDLWLCPNCAWWAERILGVRAC
jgi:hypothetical protein